METKGVVIGRAYTHCDGDFRSEDLLVVKAIDILR